jgi:hypothetical protein
MVESTRKLLSAICDAPPSENRFAYSFVIKGLPVTPQCTEGIKDR